MGAGEAFSPEQRARLEHAVATARRQSGISFSVCVGPIPAGCEPREHAEQLLHGIAGPDEEAALVLVAPTERVVEVVTTPAARRRLSDQACGLAVLSMTTAFGLSDLVGGVVNGLRMLADAAGRPSLTR